MKLEEQKRARFTIASILHLQGGNLKLHPDDLKNALDYISFLTEEARCAELCCFDCDDYIQRHLSDTPCDHICEDILNGNTDKPSTCAFYNSRSDCLDKRGI